MIENELQRRLPHGVRQVVDMPMLSGDAIHQKFRAELVAERLVGLPVGLIEWLVEQSVLYELLAVSVELAAVVQALQREPHPPCCSLMCDDRIELKRLST
jgi:hypothetical protein